MADPAKGYVRVWFSDFKWTPIPRVVLKENGEVWVYPRYETEDNGRQWPGRGDVAFEEARDWACAFGQPLVKREAVETFAATEQRLADRLGDTLHPACSSVDTPESLTLRKAFEASMEYAYRLEKRR
jgi:hypothetical protein